MIKHSYHAKLSVWHVVLLVIILAISLPVIAKPVSSPTTLLKPSSHEPQPVLTTSWQMAHYDAQRLPQKGRLEDRIQIPGSRLLNTIDAVFP